ncbi:conjugal transfer protein TraW [Escherichia coli]|nr:conjugal transfer protein TraW [Escherichia coli]
MRCRGLIALLIWGQSVAAADLGTWGDLWPVKEPDMLTVIMQRLTALEQSGEMGRKMDAFKERVIRNSLRPPAVPGIGRTEKYGSRLFDPSVRLAADIRDNEGRVFARQGEVMNPLQYVPFNQTLYFINGDDPAQVTVLTVGLVSRAGKSLPRFWPGDFFPTFYGCHLAVLGILAL